jgi:hypothetical protein
MSGVSEDRILRLAWQDFGRVCSNHHFGFELGDDFWDLTIWCHDEENKRSVTIVKERDTRLECTKI